MACYFDLSPIPTPVAFEGVGIFVAEDDQRQIARHVDEMHAALKEEP